MAVDETKMTEKSLTKAKKSVTKKASSQKNVASKTKNVEKNEIKKNTQYFNIANVKPILKKRLRAPQFSCEEDFNIIRKNMLEFCDLANNSQRDEDNFFDIFSNIVSEAKKGYLPAQDYLGYVFKKGLGDLIPANYETSMFWQFLSGANGNDYTLSKLRIFFARSYQIILELEDIEQISIKNNLSQENYEYVLGKLFCDAMCDELGVEINSLAEKKPVFLPQSLKLVQNFESARIKSLSRVIEFLRK